MPCSFGRSQTGTAPTFKSSRIAGKTAGQGSESSPLRDVGIAIQESGQLDALLRSAVRFSLKAALLQDYEAGELSRSEDPIHRTGLGVWTAVA